MEGASQDSTYPTLMQSNKYERKPKQTTTQDTIRIRYIPLPPEKRQAWERSMKILTEIILEILKEEGSLPEPIYMPADLAEAGPKPY